MMSCTKIYNVFCDRFFMYRYLLYYELHRYVFSFELQFNKEN
jgi:hypothetical protein